MDEQALRDSWALVSERFGEKADHEKLMNAAKKEYKRLVRNINKVSKTW